MTLLDVDTATAYLLESRLVDAAAIVAGDLVVRSALRRNRNLRVERRWGAGYLLKQPDPGEWGGARTLSTEAGFHCLCQEDPAASAVTVFVPRLHRHEPSGPLLVFELLAGTQNLWNSYSARPALEFPVEIARALGRAVGTVHAAFGSPPLADHPFVTALPATPPWVLSVHQPTSELLGRLGAAHRQTLRILQAEEGLCARLDALRPEWRVETLVHGDLKSDNVLVAELPGEPPAVSLVDWEMVQRGDPAWDLAGVLQDFVLFWISRMPLDPKLAPEARVARAETPLTVLQLAIRAFWHGYRQAAAPTASESADLQRRAVLYSAARLIQSAYEKARGYDRLAADAVLALQIAANVLDRPAEAAFHLYGLAPVIAAAAASSP
jgi:aminoglycoside phosphotransferase (APT) family kinase protein